MAAVQAAKDQFGTVAEAEGAPGVGCYTMTDALVDVGRVFLDTAPEDPSGEDRTVVTVHVSAELLGDVPAGTPESDGIPAGTPEANVCHIDGQGSIQPETARRLACDNPILPAVVGAGGRRWPLVGLGGWSAERSGGPWAAGGRTDLDNLVLICQFHHTAVHEGHLSIAATGRVGSSSPDGRLCEVWHTDQFLPQRLAFQFRQAQDKIANVDRFTRPDARPIQPAGSANGSTCTNASGPCSG